MENCWSEGSFLSSVFVLSALCEVPNLARRVLTLRCCGGGGHGSRNEAGPWGMQNDLINEQGERSCRGRSGHEFGGFCAQKAEELQLSPVALRNHFKLLRSNKHGCQSNAWIGGGKSLEASNLFQQSRCADTGNETEGPA